MVVYSFYQVSIPYHQVDIFLENPIDFETAYQAKQIMGVEYLSIPVISLEHLIQLKSLTERKQNKADIEALEKVKKIKEQGGKKDD